MFQDACSRMKFPQIDGVAIKCCAKVDRLEPELHDPSGATPEWHGPGVSAGSSPVSGKDGCGGQIPALLQVVVDEVLQ
jgi:hypothetical protein